MTNTDQLRELVDETLSEYSIHPQETHEGSCCYWNNEDDYKTCDCSYRFEFKQYKPFLDDLTAKLEAHTATAVRAARIDEREKAIIEAQIVQRETEKADVWDSAEELNAYKSAIRDVVLDHGDRLDALNKGESNE